MDVASEPEAPFKFSVSLAPSVLWPRLTNLNHSLAFSGNAVEDQAYHAAGAPSASHAAGYKTVSMCLGGVLTFTHEFDEDFRAGIQTEFMYLSTKEDLKLTPSTGGTIWSATNYFTSQQMTLPVLKLAVFFQRVFRFEEEPNLRLYMGGWGEYGMLFFATMEGKTYDADAFPVTEYRYKADLSGGGWGAGLLGGVEYTMTSFLVAYLETGWDWFIINRIARSGTIDRWWHYSDADGEHFSHMGTDYYNNPSLQDGNDKKIDLDLSGVFIRGGLKLGLGF